MKSHAFALLVGLLVVPFAIGSPTTERQYLSGHGPKDAVPWNFTVTGGRRAGEKTTIPVPSNWELQGFGSYNYGQQRTKSDEHGLYEKRFSVSPDWKGRRIWIVFAGAMTDVAVTINGKSAGPVHQGGFTQFRYEITSLVKLGAGPENENVLNVDVAKVSADAETERAERGGDYWVFGGIYRPVWLEATPVQAIEHVAIDAKADGALTADVTLAGVKDVTHLEAQVVDAAGKPFGAPITHQLRRGGTGRTRIAAKFDAPARWSAETPHLYTLRVTLHNGADALHAVERRFGFRTFEVRDGDGLYVNGQRVLLKGVNRHSFRPETGRALDAEDCYTDVRLIREMNMNAVRMSHYPPDEVFLDACDELGLYVLDELSGWQRAHGTAIGRLLVREIVEHDVNHPSIVFWDNGNEGGWNRDLDGEFALYDPQRRRVLHPWELHDGVNTKHYPNYDDFATLLKGKDLVMPTEFLHGLYDGGAGAGLEDYWRAIQNSPVGAGGFIWVYADEGVVRTDRGGKIDVFSTFAPDGIVGPHLEKEGSFYAVRDIWAHVQVAKPALGEAYEGQPIELENHYDFTSLAQCRFRWQLLDLGTRSGPELPAKANVIASGEQAGPDIAPHARGTLALQLPERWHEADAVAVTAVSPRGEAVWTWAWRTSAGSAPSRKAAGGAAKAATKGDVIELSTGDLVATFDGKSGLLRNVRRGTKDFALNAGPRLAYAKSPVADGTVTWVPFADEGLQAGTRSLKEPALINLVEIEIEDLRGSDVVGVLKLEISSDGTNWNPVFDASRRPQDGTRFEFPPQRIAAVRLSNVGRFDGRAPVLKTFRAGYAAYRFPAPISTAAAVSSGNGPEGAWLEAVGGVSGLDRLRWTLAADGSLRLDYQYTVDGNFAYHGVTFDHPEDQIGSFRWRGQGPYRVWQNRLRGTTYGLHEHVRHVIQPGEAFEYPEFEGYFAGVQAVDFATAAGRLSIANETTVNYMRVGTPRVSAATTTVDFPPGEISFVRAIPAIGSKGKPPERAGPASQYARGHGQFGGALVFRFGP